MARGILVVERYGALGIAIAAALKKFAPAYVIRVVATLDEAASAAESIQPELLVLDLFPAPKEEVAFFDRFRVRYPAARVLAIATGGAAGLPAFRGTAAAFQFIEKPFELPVFGAAVQALLESGTEAPPNAYGLLRDLHLIDLAQLKCLARSNAIVRVEGRGSRSGEIHFREGEIFHATAGGLTGLPALEEMMRWSLGKMRESENFSSEPRTIVKPWPALLQKLSHKLEIVRPAVSAPAPFPSPAPAQPRKTILVIDDTETLLTFVAEALTIADRTLRVLTAPTGSEGLKLAKENRPDLVLLDYCLTDMKGDEVCGMLQSTEETARIPVLLMSGHLSEMERTARTYSNVIATLPKPFLSQALIDQVEKLLAAGPLPPPPVAETSPPVAESPAADVVAPSPNGHVTGSNGDFAAPPATDFQTSPAAALLAPSEEMGDAPSRQTAPAFSRGLATETKEVTATFACEVISVQLAADFRMGALQLKPADAGILVRMSGASSLGPEKDFRLGPVQLNAEGKIDTITIVPTTKLPHAPPSEGDFAVDRVSTSASAEGRLVELTGTQSGAMRVQLSAQFQLLRVDLSETFDVALAVLQAQSNSVRVLSGNDDAVAMQFYLRDVQLDDSQFLTGLSVSSRS
jgi:DNA-binding response OmpR family regulator